MNQMKSYLVMCSKSKDALCLRKTLSTACVIYVPRPLFKISCYATATIARRASLIFFRYAVKLRAHINSDGCQT